MSALSYILTSPPRRVCNENLQQENIRESTRGIIVEVGRVQKGSLLPRKNTRAQGTFHSQTLSAYATYTFAGSFRVTSSLSSAERPKPNRYLKSKRLSLRFCPQKSRKSSLTWKTLLVFHSSVTRRRHPPAFPRLKLKKKQKVHSFYKIELFLNSLFPCPKSKFSWREARRLD